jgi:hypothetical protein
VTSALKTINYRGGVVRFRIPADWQEEHEPDGGGTFYKPGDDTGTLRLNVITAQLPAGQTISSATAQQYLSSDAAKHAQPVVPLREGIALLRYDQTSEEQGQQIKMRIWRIAQAIHPSHLRHTMFTYTLRAAQFEEPRFANEMAMLDRELRSCELALTIGQAQKKKPSRRLW